MGWKGARVLAILAVAGLAASGSEVRAADEEPAAPRIYRWIDENGVAHYTTDRSRIPEMLRDRIDRDPAPRSAGPDGEASVAKDAAPAPSPGAVDSWAVRDRGDEPEPQPAPPPDVWSEGSEEEQTEPAPEPAAPEQVAARSDRLAELSQQIASLEAQVEADEEALKDYISDAGAGGPLARAGDPEFRAIAQRLPRRLAELRALREERASLVAE